MAAARPVDPAQALLARPKLKKATNKRGKDKSSKQPGHPPSPTLVPTVPVAPGGDEVDNLADRLLDSLNPITSPEEPVQPPTNGAESSTPASLVGTPTTTLPSQPSSSNSLSSASPRKMHSISRKLGHLGEDLKDALTPQGPQKRNRQKERLAKRAAKDEQARQEARNEVEALGPGGNKGRIEDEGLEKACQKLHVKMVEMDPDGHCLFSAVADQLNIHQAPATPYTPAPMTVASNPFANPSITKGSKGPHTYVTCRRSAAEYMRAHPNDFLPYLPGEDDGGDGLMNEREYANHCDLVEKSGEWGGEPEILALSRCFRYPIHVVQAHSPMVKIGDEEFGKARNGQALILSYHRLSYGLGEHYNSLRPLKL